MIKRIKDHQYAQCHVVSNEETKTIQLVSYNTIVIVAIPFGESRWRLSCSGTYSQTTRRHISWFLSEYFPSCTYYDMKAIAGTGETFITMRRAI